jgi:hypothetical protein
MEGLSVCKWPLNFITFYKEQDPDPHRSERLDLDPGIRIKVKGRIRIRNACLLGTNRRTNMLLLYTYNNHPVLFLRHKNAQGINCKDK